MWFSRKMLCMYLWSERPLREVVWGVLDRKSCWTCFEFVTTNSKTWWCCCQQAPSLDAWVRAGTAAGNSSTFLSRNVVINSKQLGRPGVLVHRGQRCKSGVHSGSAQPHDLCVYRWVGRPPIVWNNFLLWSKLWRKPREWGFPFHIGHSGLNLPK